MPSSWGHVEMPGPFIRAVHAFYRKLQYAGSRFSPGSARQQELQRSAHSYIGDAERRLDKEST